MVIVECNMFDEKQFKVYNTDNVNNYSCGNTDELTKIIHSYLLTNDDNKLSFTGASAVYMSGFISGVKKSLAIEYGINDLVIEVLR